MPVAAVALFVVVGACSFSWTETVRGSGNGTTQTRSQGRFDALQVSGGLDVQVVVDCAADPELRVVADDNQVPYVMSSLEGSTLRVRIRPGYRLDPPARIEVSAPSLSRFALAGTGTVEIDGARGPQLALEIAGSGEIAATGNVDRLVVDCAGSGEFNLFDLPADVIRIRVIGSGEAQVHARESLDVVVQGSGDVVYRGDPRITRSIAGSGEIRQAR